MLPTTHESPRPPLLVIAGPTASGKTGLALQLAERVPIEVVSADSRQVYRGLDVGTAKPTPAEQRHVPHHLIDVADPGETFSARRFSGLARPAIVDIERRAARPVVVGGTGFYIQALLTGSPLGATPPDPEHEAASFAPSKSPNPNATSPQPTGPSRPTSSDWKSNPRRWPSASPNAPSASFALPSAAKGDSRRSSLHTQWKRIPTVVIPTGKLKYHLAHGWTGQLKSVGSVPKPRRGRESASQGQLEILGLAASRCCRIRPAAEIAVGFEACVCRRGQRGHSLDGENSRGNSCQTAFPTNTTPGALDTERRTAE